MRRFAAKNLGGFSAGDLVVASDGDKITFYWEQTSSGLIVDFPSTEAWSDYCAKPDFGWALPFYEAIQQAVLKCQDFQFENVEVAKGSMRFW